MKAQPAWLWYVIGLGTMALALVGCKYDPDYGDGQVQCGPGGICPSGLVCDVDNVCRRTPTGGDVDARVMTDSSVEIDGRVDIDAAPDITPPETILVSSPSAISGGSVTFVVDSSEAGSSFRCSLDDVMLMPCPATMSYPSLAAGPHTFRAAARDAAGNDDASPIVFMWTVDLTVLDTTITTGPGATSGRNPQFVFTSTRPGTFECVLEPTESEFTTCTSPKSYAGLVERPAPGYTFRVRARDLAGNVDDSRAQRTFLVDATGPTITISAPIANATVGPSVSLVFNMEAGATYTCRLDALAVVSPCSSPRTFSGMTSAMPHVLQVVGTDAFANATTQMVSFTVDDVGPSVSIAGTPAANSTVNTTSASLTFTPIPPAEPMATFECKFNTALTFTACTSFNMAGFIEGTQTLQVRAKDRFNNIGGTVTYSWTITSLNTTINAIRLGSVATGTRVRIAGSGVKMTAKTNDRFWMQDIDGNSISPPPDRHGITVRPTSNPLGDAMLVPGRALTVLGTVAEVTGNTTLINASYVPTAGTLLVPYIGRDTNRDSLILLSEVNEGLLVNSAGEISTTAAPTCQDLDFCIVTCERTTPVVNATNGAGSLMIGRDHLFEGIVEGAGTTYTYFVTYADEASDACL